MGNDRPYHHGDLRRALLDAAVDAIAQAGVAGLSLRDLARRAGVSHAAPGHHFGSKAGLLTALATEGYAMLAEALRESYERTGQFLEVGMAYVRFALDHPSHFAVMFEPSRYDADDPALAAARDAAAAQLYGPVGSVVDGDPGRRQMAGIAAWSVVHGFVTLWTNGNLPPSLGDDPEAAARRAASFLFRAAQDARGEPGHDPEGA